MIKTKIWGKEIPLWDASIPQEEPFITPYLLEDEKVHPAMLVIPGGGYTEKVDHEKAPIAKAMNEMGFHAFVLDYRVAPYRWPAPLLDCQRAIRYIRLHAEEYRVDPEKLGLIGFSAGGHLCGMAGTVYDRGNADAADEVERYSCRPDVFVPCYAVLDMGRYCHEGSKAAIVDKRWNDQNEIDALTAWNNVTEDTPPCYLYHTAPDDLVPVENSLLMAMALKKHQVPFELTVFPYGGHGTAMGQSTPLANRFPLLLGEFLHSVFGE